jgi:hypothetical protein
MRRNDNHKHTPSYLTIIQLLLKAKANIFIHDKNDKTFLHKAITILSDRHFKQLLKSLNTINKTALVKSFQYTDENDDDLYLACLRNFQFTKFEMLLTYHVDCFQKEYKSAGQYVEKLEAIIKSCHSDHREVLAGILRDNHIDLGFTIHQSSRGMKRR